ncbi:MAG: hypothetical protein ACJ74Q_08495 [Pyrinomonadaceae bacterium]
MKETNTSSEPRTGRTNVDTPPNAPIKCHSRTKGQALYLEESAVTLIKIIIITLAVILSILFFGRFLF